MEFCYTLSARYSGPVQHHSFSLLFQPSDTNRQQILRLETEISDQPPLRWTTDQFRNRKLYGCIETPHDSFTIRVSGEAKTGLDIFEEYTADPVSCALFKVQTPLTAPGEAIREYRRKLAPAGGAYDRALRIMRSLHDTLRYCPGSTAVHEPAETAFALGQGVCQDYAHIMLSLLRLEGIPARYVVGMTLGEGASHAWVEALCKGYWYGFDPTNGRLVDDDYIRVSCGRDSGDCSIIRGTFYGLVTQVQREQVIVEEC